MSKKNNIKNILCIVAHPDDEALGVGGTLIKHVKNGDKVSIIILSEGESSKTDKKEFNFLGYSKSPTITISQNDPLPLKVLGVAMEIQFA